MPFSATTRLLYWHRGKRFCIFHRHLRIYVLLAAKLTTIRRRLGDCGVTMHRRHRRRHHPFSNLGLGGKLMQMG